MDTEKKIIDEMINFFKKYDDGEITFKQFIENHIENTKNTIYLNGNQKLLENYNQILQLKKDIESQLNENVN